jgi:multiple sugar transport system permease protein
MSNGDLLHVVTSDSISDRRRSVGRLLIWGGGLLVVLVALAQTLQAAEIADFGFQRWRCAGAR